MKKLKFISIYSLSTLIAFSCSEPAQEKSDDTEEQNTTEETVDSDLQMEMPSEASFKLDLIIANNIAAPVKLLIDMNSAGLDHYQADATNPIDKASSYVTAQEKALAYGAYGADLSYQALYKQNDKMADYLIVIRDMSDDLGMTALFDQESFERFDRIKENPDSVKMFVFDKYDQADGFLRDNDRLVIASLILTGGLIESLHLVSSQIETGDATKDAYMIFLEQKITLRNLIDLYKTIEEEGQEIPIREDIEKLYEKFNEVNSYEVFSKENIKPLHEAIDEVRSSIL